MRCLSPNIWWWETNMIKSKTCPTELTKKSVWVGSLDAQPCKHRISRCHGWVWNSSLFFCALSYFSLLLIISSSSVFFCHSFFFCRLIHPNWAVSSWLSQSISSLSPFLLPPTFCHSSSQPFWLLGLSVFSSSISSLSHHLTVCLASRGAWASVTDTHTQAHTHISLIPLVFLSILL